MSFASSPVGLYTGRINNLRFGVQNNNEARMGLANRASASGNNPAFLGAIAKQDTQLEIQNQSNSFIADALFEMRKAAKKQDKENIQSSFNTFA